MPEIILAETPEAFAAAGTLFRAYAAWLGMDLGYQNFERELEDLPSMYTAPHGGLVLARDGTAYLGCCAVRALDGPICELKRLWVEPQATGMGLGRQLAARVVDVARTLGYERMRLDTIPTRMIAAGRIYTALGFVEIPKYYDNPNEGIAYLELDLRSGDT